MHARYWRGMNPTHALEADGITKRYPGGAALEGVRLEVRPGEVHALVGKNGAGKSTLVRILSGAERPDAGTIRLGGRAYAGFSPASAQQAGIATVYQEQQLVGGLTVAENVFLGVEPRLMPGVVNHREMERRTAALAGEHGLDLRPAARLESLDVAQRQQVTILKSLHRRATVLLLDEPTAALNKVQTSFLYELIGRLTDQGLAVLFISHYLDEVLALSNRVTVLRDGRVVVTVAAASTSKAEVVQFMVGEAPGERLPPAQATCAEAKPLLELHGFGLDLVLRAGEVIGLTGTLGAGARELGRAIGGVGSGTGGGRLVHQPNSAGQGVVFLPEDMRREGLVWPLTITHNITLGSLAKVAPHGFIRHRQETAASVALVDSLRIQPPDARREVGTLSGGNKRKVLFARGLQTGFQVLVTEEPTQGVDIQARRELHHLIRELAGQGKAVVVVSTDLEELIEVSDRLLVMREGALWREHLTADTSAAELLASIQGGN